MKPQIERVEGFLAQASKPELSVAAIDEIMDEFAGFEFDDSEFDEWSSRAKATYSSVHNELREIRALAWSRERREERLKIEMEIQDEIGRLLTRSVGANSETLTQVVAALHEAESRFLASVVDQDQAERLRSAFLQAVQLVEERRGAALNLEELERLKAAQEPQEEADEDAEDSDAAPEAATQGAEGKNQDHVDWEHDREVLRQFCQDLDELPIKAPPLSEFGQATLKELLETIGGAILVVKAAVEWKDGEVLK